jgi:hypothetical protein
MQIHKIVECILWNYRIKPKSYTISIFILTSKDQGPATGTEMAKKKNKGKTLKVEAACTPTKKTHM